jgi:inner membrane protein
LPVHFEIQSTFIINSSQHKKNHLNTNYFENQKNRITNSVSMKILVIGILILLLLIPSGMIKRLITEREKRRDETIAEVTSKWGNAQTLCGPVLTIPYLTYVDTKDGIKKSRYRANFLPDELTISGTLIPEIRYRGIYEVIAYNTKLKFKGKFGMPVFSGWRTDEMDLLPDEAFLSLGITDMRGINRNIMITWNDSVLIASSGLKSNDIMSSGVTAGVPVRTGDGYEFSFELDLNGSDGLNFVPLGKETNVYLNSTWSTPSFDGAFLPDEREVTDTGFTAHWNILQLNRNYPQKWIDHEFSVNDSEFGIKLILPVDNYQKATRSVKYSVLFITLTFLVFFFSEVLNKKRIHFIQYLLVGVALTIFYSLLIALSEHIGFNPAYLIASMAIAGLITVFFNAIFENKRATIAILLVLVALYVFLFTILQLADYSLLFGNIGLFVVLALVMYFSRKIDWFGIVNKKNEH